MPSLANCRSQYRMQKAESDAGTSDAVGEALVERLQPQYLR